MHSYRTKRNGFIRLAALAATMAIPAIAFTQSYPVKPIRIVTQFQAGSSGDSNMRALVEPLSQYVGQPVIVDNRPGAGGVLAAEHVANSPPDGYSLLAASSATQVIRGWIVKGVSLDPVKSFSAITQLSEPVVVIVANPSMPFNTLPALLEYARNNPGKLSYGSSGIGSEHHLSGEQIRQLTGVDIVHVPYKATAQALLDVVTGQLPLTFTIYAAAGNFINTKKVKAIAVVRKQRVGYLPNLQTVNEVIPQFEEPPMWTGLFGPAALPDPIVRRIYSEAARSLQSPSVRARYAAAGNEAVGSSPAEFAARIKRDNAFVERLVRSSSIQAE